MKIIDISKCSEDVINYINKFQNNYFELEKLYKEKESEIERLHSIIKEVREYIEHENFKRNILLGLSEKKYTRDILNKILEILDKENI